MWAFSGGKVNRGKIKSETHEAAMRREFIEETLSKPNGESEQQAVKEMFQNCFEFFKGYIDDSKNTDFAWMEGVAFICLDITGTLLKKIIWNIDRSEISEIGVFPEEEILKLQLHASHNKMFKDAIHKVKEKYPIHNGQLVQTTA